jgi:hypothetical protein
MICPLVSFIYLLVSYESNDNQPSRFKSKEEFETQFEREKRFLKGFQVSLI